MKTIEFTVSSIPDGQITIPAEIVQQVPSGEQLHVVLAWGACDSDDDWRAGGLRRFEAAFAPEDDVYEQLIHDAPSR